jgi:rhodanese-related sulfurtransferase
MKKALLLTFIILMTGFTYTALGADGTPRMTTEELKGQLGNPDVVIVDVRVSSAWKKSKDKIKGAVREDPRAVEDWIDKYPKDKIYVFYCD